MSTRLLAFVLLAGASVAAAAPPQQDPANTGQPADTIDVDALARSKDVGGATPAAEDAPAPATQDLAQPPSMPQDAASPAESPPAESPPPQAPAAETPSAEPPAEMVAEPAASASEAAPSIAGEPAAADTTSTATRESPAAAPSESAEKVSIAASCESRASSLLDQAQKADYGNVTRDFDAKMRTDMPAPKFRQQWESLSQFGKLVARGQSHLGSGEGYTIVMIPLIFEKTNLVAQIACGSDGRIAGFHVTQAPKPKF